MKFLNRTLKKVFKVHKGPHYTLKHLLTLENNIKMFKDTIS